MYKSDAEGTLALAASRLHVGRSAQPANGRRRNVNRDQQPDIAHLPEAQTAYGGYGD
jgi:hypothetical protein